MLQLSPKESKRGLRSVCSKPHTQHLIKKRSITRDHKVINTMTRYETSLSEKSKVLDLVGS